MKDYLIISPFNIHHLVSAKDCCQAIGKVLGKAKVWIYEKIGTTKTIYNHRVTGLKWSVEKR